MELSLRSSERRSYQVAVAVRVRLVAEAAVDVARTTATTTLDRVPSSCVASSLASSSIAGWCSPSACSSAWRSLSHSASSTATATCSQIQPSVSCLCCWDDETAETANLDCFTVTYLSECCGIKNYYTEDNSHTGIS